MQKITRETIRQLASSETVYYRGMRYYAAHAVSKVTWSEVISSIVPLSKAATSML